MAFGLKGRLEEPRVYPGERDCRQESVGPEGTAHLVFAETHPMTERKVKPVCSCGSRRFARLKMGGSIFSLQWWSKVVLWRLSGFTPTIAACRDCGMIHFLVPKELLEQLENEP
jgi:hypothetical protein